MKVSILVFGAAASAAPLRVRQGPDLLGLGEDIIKGIQATQALGALGIPLPGPQSPSGQSVSSGPKTAPLPTSAPKMADLPTDLINHLIATTPSLKLCKGYEKETDNKPLQDECEKRIVALLG